MADARAGLDAGHLGVFRDGADEPRAAPGNEQIHQPHGLHQLRGAIAGGVLHQTDELGGKAGGFKPRLHGRDNGLGGGKGLLAAPEDAGAAGLEGKSRGVGGDVGAAFIDDGHHTHGHAHLVDGHAVGADDLPPHPAHGVGKGSHLAYALGHVQNALAAERQAVDHHRGDVPLGGGHIPAVGLQDLAAICLQGSGHGQERLVFLRGGGLRQGGSGGFDGF